MSPRVISNPNSKSRLALHAKRDKLKLEFFIVYLKKCDFLQTTPSMGKLYSKLKFSDRRVDTYYFRVQVTAEEIEMAIWSHGSRPPLLWLPLATQRRRWRWDRDLRHLRSPWLPETRRTEIEFQPNHIRGGSGLMATMRSPQHRRQRRGRCQLRSQPFRTLGAPSPSACKL